MSYATLAEFKSAVGITDSADDNALHSVLDATDALIDNYTDRRQGFGTATETRYYTAQDFQYVLTDDLVSISSLTTDDDGNNTYETTWTAGTDYVFAPANNALEAGRIPALRSASHGRRTSQRTSIAASRWSASSDGRQFRTPSSKPR